jgi:hypothetical protein
MLEGAVRNLNGTDRSASPPEQQPDPTPEAAPAEPVAADGDKPEGTGVKDGSPPSQDDFPNDVQGLRSATIGERKRRQEAEQKLSDREKEFAELQKRLEKLESGGQPQGQKPAAKPAEVPDPWLDPEGYARHIQAETEKRTFATLVTVSQGVMRSKHDDYDDVEKIFRDECKSNPYLAKQLRDSPFPAQFAYEQGKRLMALREIGDDPAAFRAKIEADIKAKIEAEKAAPPPSAQPSPAPAASAPPTPQPPPPPPSLAGVTSSAPRKATAKFEGPTPLDAILK